VSTYAQTCQDRVGAILDKKKKLVRLSRLERMQVLILEMLHFDPKQRPGSNTMYDRMQTIAPEL
jgi:hypothetical protein